MEKRISVFGSCVSRDILNLEKCVSNEVVPGICVERESFASAVSLPVANINERSITLESAFQRRMVEWDVSKRSLDIMRSNAPEYLLIDFMEERFDLAVVRGENGECTLVTFSDEFRRSGLEYEKTFFWQDLSESFEGVTFEERFSLFCNLIRSMYDPNNIILNKAYYCDAYYDLSGKPRRFDESVRRRTRVYNSKLNKLYTRFEQLIPEAKVLDYCEGYLGFEGHRWGLYYAHYQNEYYEQAASSLCSMLFDGNTKLWDRVLYAVARHNTNRVLRKLDLR